MSVHIEFSKNVTLYLAELVRTLIDSGYFHFYENSVKYVQEIVNEIVSTIHCQPKRPAPLYFSRYGENMYYITCKRNRTTWYVFFTVHGEYEDYYIVRYITNNHIAGHHFSNHYLTDII